MEPVPLLTHIQSRRSIRKYQQRPVPQAVIERVLEAARWGPSAHNRQPWRFTVLTKQQHRSDLADAMAARLQADLRADGVDEDIITADTGRSQARLKNAPVVIVVSMTMADMDRYPDERRQHFEWVMATQSVAMAAQNLLLMAHAEGLGAVWMCAPLFCPETVREVVGIPAGLEPQGIVAMGYPAQERTRTREPLSSRVVFR
ncbi:MAG: nitroreductase family protein [Chloroflexi bacterium]|nr:nitroreductase family protein [Chloroflexota bacterium]